MSRNGSGTFTLSVGNPVVTGTPVSSTWANGTMGDLATEVTDSLSRSGKGAMLAPLELTDGSVTAPSVTFDTDTNTGLYRIAADNPGMAVGGVKNADWSATGDTHFLGLTVTNSQTDGSGVVATGNGTGAGVAATGGASGGSAVYAVATGGNGTGVEGTGQGSGTGLFGAGGATNGTGARGIGGGTTGIGVAGQGASSGIGVQGTGGASGGAGVRGVGTHSSANGVEGTSGTSGAGVKGTGVSSGVGVHAVGSAARSPLLIEPRASAPGSAIEGEIYYDSSTHKLYVCTDLGWVVVGTQS